MPKKVDHKLKRQELARAALSVIGDTGLEGLRLVDVGEAAGATTGTVTHYLGDKNSVLIAALDEVAHRIDRNFGRLEGARDAKDLIDATCRLLPFDGETRRDWRVWIAYWGGAIGDADLAERHREHYDRFRNGLAGHIRRMPNTARLPHSPEMIADLVISALDGVGTRATLEPDLWPPQRQKDHLNALLAPILTPVPCSALAS